jgi:DNA-binding transcriptional LysR family regulator
VFPIASPGLAATLGAEPSPAALLEHPILNDSNTEGWRLWLAEAGLDYVPRARDRRFEDYNMVLDACVSGLGLALARPPLSDPALASGRVVALDRRTSRYHVAFQVIRPSEPLRPAAAEVARRILSEAGVSDSEREAFVAASGRSRG